MYVYVPDYGACLETFEKILKGEVVFVKSYCQL